MDELGASSGPHAACPPSAIIHPENTLPPPPPHPHAGSYMTCTVWMCSKLGGLNDGVNGALVSWPARTGPSGPYACWTSALPSKPYRSASYTCTCSGLAKGTSCYSLAAAFVLQLTDGRGVSGGDFVIFKLTLRPAGGFKIHRKIRDPENFCIFCLIFGGLRLLLLIIITIQLIYFTICAGERYARVHAGQLLRNLVLSDVHQPGYGPPGAADECGGRGECGHVCVPGRGSGGAGGGSGVPGVGLRRRHAQPQPQPLARGLGPGAWA